MSDPIPEHTLELLAAGALSPEQSALLLQRIKALPEVNAKLDALIEANERFHQDYPAQLLLPHILRRAHSSAQARHNKRAPRKKMKTLQAPLYGFAAIAAITLVIVGISQLTHKDSARQRDEATVQTVTTPQATKALTTTPPLPSIPQLWAEGELIFQLGEARSFSANELDKISVESSELISVRPNKSGDQITLTPLKAGLTTLQLTRADEQRVRYVRVAKATDDAIIAEALKTGQVRVAASCLEGASLGERRFRLVIDPKGGVLSALLDESDDLDTARLSCLLDSANAWRFKTPDSAPYSVALITLAL